MTIKEIIQKAIEGGWKATAHQIEIKAYGSEAIVDRHTNINTMVLDPKFWEAVGKVDFDGNYPTVEEYGKEFANEKMHKLIDHLNENENNTIETFIKTL